MDRGGYFIVFYGAYVVVETFKFQKMWKEYEQAGGL